MKINIDKSWNSFFEQEKNKDYFKQIEIFLNQRRNDAVVFPEENEIFNAFKLTKLDNLKVVIIGQDPYHQPGQAMGLAFSVANNSKIPPSLKNIHKEMLYDLNIDNNGKGDLTKWANQGVLLINTVLTVENSNPNSHKKIGWLNFTENLIKFLSKQQKLIFVLWGANAIEYEKIIDIESNFIIKSTHPSPFSAHRGFLGSKPFSNINNILNKINKAPIDWKI